MYVIERMRVVAGRCPLLNDLILETMPPEYLIKKNFHKVADVVVEVNEDTAIF